LTPQERFQALPHLPPLVTAPARFSFRTWRRSGDFLFLSGHGPNLSRLPPEFDYVGKVGAELTLEQGITAARLTGLNLLRTAEHALGSLDRVGKLIEMLGAVNSAPKFRSQSFVLNGCSDLMVEIFGEEVGKPVRMVLGAAELPFDMAVEIQMILEVRSEE
jgi:enamine deaminase RidA (YjgF/YER057c/UK114 family)